LVAHILNGKPHLALNLDQPGRPGLVHMAHSLAQLAVAGVPFFAWRLFEGRIVKNLRLDRLVADTAPAPLPATAWVVTNGRAIPAAKFGTPEGSRLPRNSERKSGKNVLLNLNGASPVQVIPMSSSASNPVPHESATVPAMPAAEAQPAAVPPSSQLELLMQGHHRLMNRFLDTHRSILMAALHQPAGTVAAAPAIQPHVAPVEAPRIEMPAAPQPVPIHAEPAPVAAIPAKPKFSREEVTARLLDLVSQRTGYPPDMLGLDLDLEADLGVDSIKRVEIFGALQNESMLPETAFEGQIEALSKLKTLNAIIDWVEAKAVEVLGTSNSAASTGPARVPAKVQVVTREEIAARLLDLVSQRTGYPPDMLGLDLDLEADLGVDSIKRVEIFGALQNESVLPGSAFEGQIEALSKLKTLNAIIDWVEAKAAEVIGAAVQTEPSVSTPRALAAPEPPEAASPPVTRMRVEVSDAQVASRGSVRPGFVLVTDDHGTGVAASFALRLTDLGIDHAVIAHNPRGGTDLTNPEAVAALLASLREKHGKIDALVHLMPLASVSDEAAAELETRTRTDLMSLFLLTKNLEEDLKGSGFLLAGTRLGGTFGFGPGAPSGFFAGNGAISGFMKTVVREWTGVAARTVDFELDADSQSIAKLLAEELLCRDGLTEAGYSNGSRKMLRSEKSPLGATDSGVRLDSSSVVLLTGGARGITASIALEIAKAFRPKIVLLGRSPLPPDREPSDIEGITDTKQLKAALMDRMQTGGQRPTPALIEGAVKRVKNEREIRHSIAALQAAGSTVDYFIADVADHAAMGAVLNEVYAKYGRLDGVVHGAGVIEDKLISDKTPESFDRVVSPKVAGAMSLIRGLRPEGLQFLIFFSSVSARYGNRGQCDYSAANEVLNKLALQLNSRWPGRVVSLNWGPWRTEGGMVSPELAKRFADAGVEMIEVPNGCRAFMEELVRGPKSDADVVFGGPLTLEQQAPTLAAAPASLQPFPLAQKVVRQPNGAVHAEVETDSAKHGFLSEHTLDGKPVLPFVLALEMIAETAAAARPGVPLTAIRNLKMLQGISYAPGSSRKLLVESTGGVEYVIKAADTGQIHYRGSAEYAAARPPNPPRLQLIDPRPFPLSVADAYEQWLFHGPKISGILAIDRMGSNGIVGRLKTSTPASLMQPGIPGHWIADPLITDSCLQLCLVWSRAVFDQTPLPAGMEVYYHAGSFEGLTEVLCEMEILSRQGSPTLRCRPVFYDPAGRVIAWMEGMEVTMSKSLNRLAGARSKGAAV
jgi:NAD(P)-dependent dehydrogenase (short-subunit alcohol dehydrogenase family)/acyl carrier protein